MKKLLLLVIASLLFTVVESRSELILGPKIGYSASRLSTNIDDIKHDFRSGFAVGIFGRFGEEFHFQPELSLVEKGGILEEEDINLQTVDITPLFGYYLYKEDNLNFRVNAGPLVSIIVTKDGGVIDKISETIDDAEFEDLMWGFQIGAGMDFLFMTLDIRYELEFNDIYEPPTNNYQFRNTRFSVNLGFKLL